MLTLEGKFAAGPFHSDEDSSVFSNCCFSVDGSRMVTNHYNDLFVWDVSSGSRERRIPCNTLYSLSFAASGNFLATTDIDNVFRSTM